MTSAISNEQMEALANKAIRHVFRDQGIVAKVLQTRPLEWRVTLEIVFGFRAMADSNLARFQGLRNAIEHLKHRMAYAATHPYGHNVEPDTCANCGKKLGA